MKQARALIVNILVLLLPALLENKDNKCTHSYHSSHEVYSTNSAYAMQCPRYIHHVILSRVSQTQLVR